MEIPEQSDSGSDAGFTPAHRGGFRRVRQRIWSSSIHRWARRTAAELTRPLRRLELCILYRYDLTQPIASFDAGVDVQIAQASAEDIEPAASLRVPPDPNLRELFKWRLEHDCVCFLARAGSKLVAYNWIRLSPGPEEGEMIALAVDEMYSFDLYVDENFRGNRIYTALGVRSRTFCKERGYVTAYARVSVMNRKSQKAIRRGGWRRSGLALRVRRSRGGWPIVRLWGSAHPLARLRRGDDQGYPKSTH
ncbi:MAG: GNAT family N-acetyltransferase [Candidatus Binataceae bacterium]